MNNILLIKSSSRNNTIRRYIDEIEIGFRLTGYNTTVWDTESHSNPFKGKEFFKQMDIDLIFECNAESVNFFKDNFPNTIYVTYLTSHPAFFWSQLIQLDDNAIVFTCDKNDLLFLNKYFRNIKHAKFIPMSGTYSLKHVPFTERTINVIYSGSYFNPQNYYQQVLSKFSGTKKELAKQIYNTILREPGYTFDVYLDKALHNYLTQIDQIEFCKLLKEFSPIFKCGNTYFTDKLIRTLLENGIQLHVYGTGWENFKSEQKKNLVIKKGNHYTTQKAIANAKISLQITPISQIGLSEKTTTAMLSGTISITNENSFINETFTTGRELVTYSLTHMDDLPSIILYFLHNGYNAAEIASLGKDRAENEMTWQHRTFDMISYIKESLGESPYVNLTDNYGKILYIPKSKENITHLTTDMSNLLEGVLQLIQEIQRYDILESCDIEYLYNKYMYLCLEINHYFPELFIEENLSIYIATLKNRIYQTGINALIFECKNLQTKLLKNNIANLEDNYNKIESEKNQYQNSLPQRNAKSFINNAEEILIHKILKNYGHCKDIELVEIIDNIKRYWEVNAYNQNFVLDYVTGKQPLQEVFFDKTAEMHYVNMNGKRMYYPKSHSREYVASEINFVNIEQNENSPHRYLEGEFQVQEGDIVIDAGVAEGNFALEIIEKAKKVYLVECGHDWVEALEKTFEPWKEKVVIIEKLLSDTDDDSHIRIDSFVEEGKVNFIKLDVEGAELDSLKGASHVLNNSDNIKCTICAYHRKNAERDIRNFLEQKGFYTSTTKGYMFFKEDLDSWLDGELRRGIVRGIKLTH